MNIVHRIPLAVPFIAMEMAWAAAILVIVQTLANWQSVAPLPFVVGLYPIVWVGLRLEGRLPYRTWVRWGVRLTICLTLLMGTVPIVTGMSLSTIIDACVLEQTMQPQAWVMICAAAIGAAFAMLRGWLLADRVLDGAGFIAGFHIGLLAVIAVAFAEQLADAERNVIVTLATVFLVCGLFGMWLARQQAGEATANSDDQAAWPIITLIIIAGIPILGTVMWHVLNPAFMQALMAPVFWLWNTLGDLLLWLMSLLPQPDYSELPIPEAGPPKGEMKNPIDFFDFGEIVHAIGLIMFYGSLSFILGGLLIRNLLDLARWLMKRRARAKGLTFESSDGSLVEDLVDMLFAFLGILVRLWRRLTIRTRREPYAGLSAEVRAIRQLYARLLLTCEARGLPKPAGQTPNAYLSTLAVAYPKTLDDFQTLTQAYVNVRYRDILPAAHQLRTVRAAWRRCRKALKSKPVNRQ